VFAVMAVAITFAWAWPLFHQCVPTIISKMERTWPEAPSGYEHAFPKLNMTESERVWPNVLNLWKRN
jgi:hypothetical protein